MRVEKIEWNDGKLHVSVGVVVEENKDNVVLSNDVVKSDKIFKTDSTYSVAKSLIVTRKVFQKDGWFHKDSILVTSSPKTVESGNTKVVVDKSGSVEISAPSITVSSKTPVIKTKSVKSKIKSKVSKTKVYPKYNGPFAGKFDVVKFKSDMTTLNVSQLAKKYKMSWFTAKQVVKYLTPKARGRKPKISETEFIDAYKTMNKLEIASKYGVCYTTVSRMARKLLKNGKIKAEV